MSATVIVRFPVSDMSKVKESFEKHASLLDEISKQAQDLGAKHHHFFQGDGELVAVDEWADRESFDSFFMDNDKIQTVTSDAGVDGTPKVEFLDTFDAPGAF